MKPTMNKWKRYSLLERAGERIVLQSFPELLFHLVTSSDATENAFSVGL